ncbi:hypothetical protein V6N13_046878 [Hibiscus sabdariffa]
MSLTSENLGGEFPTLSETHGGRPPEIVAFPPRSATLERQGSPLAIELQPVTKRGKGEFQTRDDFDVCMNVSEEDGQMGDRLNEVHRSAQEQVGMTASFRDTLVGNAVAVCCQNFDFLIEFMLILMRN